MRKLRELTTRIPLVDLVEARPSEKWPVVNLVPGKGWSDAPIFPGETSPKVKSKDEKAFVAMHVVQKHTDPDHLGNPKSFSGDVKIIDRPSTRQGHKHNSDNVDTAFNLRKIKSDEQLDNKRNTKKDDARYDRNMRAERKLKLEDLDEAGSQEFISKKVNKGYTKLNKGKQPFKDIDASKTKAKYASARQRKEMSKKHPELAEENTWYVDEYGRPRRVDESGSIAKNKLTMIKHPKFDKHGNLVLTKVAKDNMTYGKKARKLSGKNWDPKIKRFGEEKEELDEMKKSRLGDYLAHAIPDKKNAEEGLKTRTKHGFGPGELERISKNRGEGIDRAASRMRGVFDVGQPRKMMIPGDETNKVYSQKKRKLYRAEETQLDEGGPTKKHFKMAAETIKSIEDDDKRREHASSHADTYQKQNPRFSRDKFMQACNVKEETEVDEGFKRVVPTISGKKYSGLGRGSRQATAANKVAQNRNAITPAGVSNKDVRQNNKNLNVSFTRKKAGQNFKEETDIDEGKGYTNAKKDLGPFAKDPMKDTVLVSPKGYKGGGKVRRIPKSQYDPKKHSLAEDKLDPKYQKVAGPEGTKGPRDPAFLKIVQNAMKRRDDVLKKIADADKPAGKAK